MDNNSDLCIAFNYSYNEKEPTYIDEFGRELCKDTIIAKFAFEELLGAYTEVVGGEYEDNLNLFCQSGYTDQRTGLDKIPAESLKMQSEAFMTVIVNAKILEELQDCESYIAQFNL